MTASDRLVQQVLTMDQEAFAARVVAQFLPALREELSGLTLHPDPLVTDALSVLVIGSISELLQALALDVEVDGPEGDPILSSFAMTIDHLEAARPMLAGIDAETGRTLTPEEAEVDRVRGLAILDTIIGAFRTSFGRPAPPEDDET